MVPFVFRKKPPKVTYFLLISFASVYALQFWSSSAVYIYLGLVPKLIMKGYLWQLATFVFLHAALLNLLLNAVYLWLLGTDIEKEIGTSSYITLLMFCVIGSGSLLTITRLTSDPLIPIGGSLVISYGLIGAYIYLFPNVYLFYKKLKLRYILILFLIGSFGSPLVFGSLGAALIGYLFVRLNKRSLSHKPQNTCF